MNTSKFILIGSGDFATEISEYITDKNKESSNKQLIISDIVSKTEDRFDEICSILGYKPLYHNTLTTINEKDDKSALVCLGSSEKRHTCYQELIKNKLPIFNNAPVPTHTNKFVGKRTNSNKVKVESNLLQF